MSRARASRAAVITLDLLILFLLILIITIIDTGGGRVRIGGLRVTAETAWRPALWLAGLLAFRLILDRVSGPFGRTWRGLAAAVGLGEPLSVTPLPSLREVVLVTAGLAVAVAVVLHRQIADLYGVPDLGDPLFSMWRMGWVAHQIVADPRRLFDANIFHPEAGTLTYSDSMLLPALTAAPLVWLGVPIAVAYCLLFLSAFVVSGTATYVLARAMHVPAGGAWVAGLLFALCPYRMEHYSHLELQMAQWMPLTLLAAHRVLATGQTRYVLCLALVVGAQWYSSMYYGVFLMFYAGAFVAVLAFASRVGWRRFAAAVVGLLLGVGLALPLARAYKATEASRGTRGPAEVQWYSAEAADYLQPNLRSVHRGWQFRERIAERELFPNVTPILLGAAGLWPPLSASRLALLFAGAVAFDGSLGFNGHWYAAAYQHLGPIRSMRVPARFAILVSLTLALLAGTGAARLAARASAKAHRLILAGLTLLVMVESMPHLVLQPVWRDPPPLYSTLGPDSGAVLFEFPIRPDSEVENFPYIYFATSHWTKTVNGYSGFTPRSFEELTRKTVGFPQGDTVRYLQQRGVTHVTLHCALWFDEPCAWATERMSQDARFALVTATRWQGKPAYLYELRR